MHRIVTLYRRCHDDTRTLLNHGKEKPLESWLDKPLEEIKKKIVQCVCATNPIPGENGREIHRRGGVSLEDIVLLYPEEFEPDVVVQARKTLGIP